MVEIIGGANDRDECGVENYTETEFFLLICYVLRIKKTWSVSCFILVKVHLPVSSFMIKKLSVGFLLWMNTDHIPQGISTVTNC